MGLPLDRYLEICKDAQGEQDSKLKMFVELDSPGMRDHLYVEVYPTTTQGDFENCKTWCRPPVKICNESMDELREFMTNMNRGRYSQRHDQRLTFGESAPPGS